MSNTPVASGQVRQERLGDVVSGSIPYKVIRTSWLLTDHWIVQNIIGQLSIVEESVIEKHHLVET